MEQLRGEKGCPWDKAQTFESLKPCMINEMTEALAGIDLYERTGEAENLCEELGDVLLQVVLLSQIAKEQGLFDITDVINGISRKMVRRHPNVFPEESEWKIPEGQDGGLDFSNTLDPAVWKAIKQAEKGSRTDEEKRAEKEAFRMAADQVIRHLSEK